MVFWLQLDCFRETIAARLLALEVPMSFELANETYIASSKFFAVKALLPWALKSSALIFDRSVRFKC